MLTRGKWKSFSANPENVHVLTLPNEDQLPLYKSYSPLPYDHLCQGEKFWNLED
jgi:hypothetical protein